MNQVEVEQAGNFGAPILLNLGFNCSIFQALKEEVLRNSLKDDRDALTSKLVNRRTKEEFTGVQFLLQHVSTLTQNEQYDLFVNDKFWGRLKFVTHK